MNKVILMGRLTKDPDVRYTQGDNTTAIARYTLAVDRRAARSQDNGQTADFISIVAFGKAGEFAEKYLHKGTKLVVSGRIQTGSYQNKDGATVYTTEVVAEDQEFAESKSSGSSDGFQGNQGRPQAANSGFMNIPEGIDEDLPFAQPTR